MSNKEVSKTNMIKAIFLGLITLVSYLLIFTNMESLNNYLLSKHPVPALALLSIVVFIAFCWGTASSCLLSYFGIEGKH